MFRLMSWQILLSASLNVWSGFFIGFIASILFGQTATDRIAIAIETGVQNTGVAIVLLGLSLPQPDADIASVVPVAASVMTPIPLTIIYFFIKLKNFGKKDGKSSPVDESLVKESFNSNKTSSSTLPLTDGNKPVDKYSYEQISWSNNGRI